MITQSSDADHPTTKAKARQKRGAGQRSQNGAAFLWNPAAESVAVWRMPHEENASLERCDSSAEPALEFRMISATHLSVANYNTTLSSDSLETGSGSSNSLRSVTRDLYRND
jgi:hypothetical protein